MKKKLYIQPELTVVRILKRRVPILASSLGGESTPNFGFKSAINDDSEEGYDAD